MSKKVGIVGSAGTVGSCVAFAVALRGLAEELVLLDVNSNLAQSHQMDLQSAVTGVCEIDIRVGYSMKDFVDVDVVVLAASAPWRKIASRMEALEANLPIVRTVAQGIQLHCPSAIVINAVNPVDPLNWVIWRQSGLPRRQCLGYSLNDSIRFQRLVSSAYRLPANAVDALVIGEHGEHMVLLFSSVRAHGKLLRVEDSVRVGIRSELARVLKDFEDLNTGRTSGWTSAIGITAIIEAIFGDTGDVFPCSVVLDGEFGHRGLSATIPVRLGRHGVRQYLTISMDQGEYEQLNTCLSFLEETVRSLEQNPR